jgi:hypothetical protein
MNKAILEFNLDDPNEANAFECAKKSIDMSLFLWQLTQNIAKRVEYAITNHEHTYTIFDVVDLYSHFVKDELEHYKIDVNSLVK